MLQFSLHLGYAFLRLDWIRCIFVSFQAIYFLFFIFAQLWILISDYCFEFGTFFFSSVYSTLSVLVCDGWIDVFLLNPFLIVGIFGVPSIYSFCGSFGFLYFVSAIYLFFSSVSSTSISHALFPFYHSHLFQSELSSLDFRDNWFFSFLWFFEKHLSVYYVCTVYDAFCVK